MTATIAAKHNAIAEMFGVSVADAKLFAALVLAGTNDGLTLEAAIERGRNVLADMVERVNNNPKAARAFVVELYEDLRLTAPTPSED
jgi:hypothetical protein